MRPAFVYPNKVSEDFKNNMNIIRLTDGQRRCSKINHPLLDGVEKMDASYLEEIWPACHEDSNQHLRDEVIMGHLYCIKNIVGRFLAHWPESQRFEDDMVSEGILATTNVVNNLKPKLVEDLQKKIWGHIKDDIEIMLNDNRSTFSASKRENYSLKTEGEEVEYNYAQSIQDGTEKGSFDNDPQFIDFMDELEQFSETDREHFRHLITQCMDQEHDIPESELSEKDKEAIEAATRLLSDI